MANQRLIFDEDTKEYVWVDTDEKFTYIKKPRLKDKWGEINLSAGRSFNSAKEMDLYAKQNGLAILKPHELAVEAKKGKKSAIQRNAKRRREAIIEKVKSIRQGRSIYKEQRIAGKENKNIPTQFMNK